MKYVIYDSINVCNFDDKEFDTVQEAGNYLDKNIGRINEMLDEIYGRPVNYKDYVNIKEVA